MRLALLVASEVAVFALTVSVVSGGLYWATTDWSSAVVIDPEPDPEPDPDPDPDPEPDPDPDPEPDPDPDPEPDPDPDPAPDLTDIKWEFEGQPDKKLLAPILSEKVVEAKLNRGGSSLSVRLYFEDGSKAAFKPRQIHTQTIPRKEVAAYRINRLLGLHSVAPAAPREFSAAAIRRALLAKQPKGVQRLDKEMRSKNGRVIGVVSWWIPVISRPTIDGHELDSNEGITLWRKELTQGESIPEERFDLYRQLSELLVFDAIINNPDRFSGGNTRGSKDKKRLYAMDNTLSFSVGKKASEKPMRSLQRSQKFSKSLIARLRVLREDDIRRVLADAAPMPYLLSDKEIADVLVRRDAVLAYVDSLIADSGADRVLVFP